MLRLLDRAIDWSFIYEFVEEKYCPDNGRPSMAPVMLIKIPFMEMAEDICHTRGNKQIYALRKETIERIFGTAKEQHST